MRPTIVLVLLFLAPVAGAGWIDHGQIEPGPTDLLDRTWETADPHEDRVYFNVYPTLFPVGANPNLAALETQLPSPLNEFRATLGVWRDCNDDGVIGSSDLALVDYPASLAADCVGTVHDDAGTIRELLPLDDSGATRVWGDFDRYESPCILLPLREGTTASAGGLLRWLGCATGVPAYELAAGAGNDLGLGLRDAIDAPFPVHPYDDPASGTPGLLQDDDPRAWSVWDCASGEPSPAVHDPRASWWAAADHAFDGAAGDCDPATRSALGEAYWALGLDREPTGPHIDLFGRRSTDVLFTYEPEERSWLAHVVYVGALGLTNARLRLADPWVFYAHVDTTQTHGARLPSTTTLPYGFQYCPDKWGWWPFVCDPDHWYEVMPAVMPGTYLPRPGDPLHLVDHDCLGVRDAGLAWPRGCP